MLWQVEIGTVKKHNSLLRCVDGIGREKVVMKKCYFFKIDKPQMLTAPTFDQPPPNFQLLQFLFQFKLNFCSSLSSKNNFPHLSAAPRILTKVPSAPTDIFSTLTLIACHHPNFNLQAKDWDKIKSFKNKNGSRNTSIFLYMLNGSNKLELLETLTCVV